MPDLIFPIFLFGLADSLNPATIAVAVVLATGRRPVPRLLLYTLGTGVTYFLGGLLLVLGPAGVLHPPLPRQGAPARAGGGNAGGVVAVAGAAWGLEGQAGPGGESRAH